MNIVQLSWLLFFLITRSAIRSSSAVSNSKIFCYWGTWAYYRQGLGKFGPANIDAKLCTHIGYAFFGIDDSGSIKLLDSWLDVDLGNIQKAIALKRVNPQLKILASVGGWNEGSTKFSAMAANDSKRSTFISSTMNFLEKYGFDGLDLDWEYPAQRGGNSVDRTNFVMLLRELKGAFAAKGYLLTVAVAAVEQSASISYDIAQITQLVDLINLMTYDFSGAWDGKLGYNSPLKGIGPLTIEKAVNFWLQQGALASKLLLGIPFYGHTFTLADKNQTSVGARCNGPGLPGPFTQQSGFLGYNEICSTISSNWVQKWDVDQSVPYAYQNTQWISYDNVQSITEKMKFLKSKQLGGAMIWSIETDDFHGICGLGYPLLQTINKELNVGFVETKLKSSTLSASHSFACSKDGFFAVPTDCTRFYECLSGYRFDFQCPDKLYFDETRNRCNWPSQVACGGKHSILSHHRSTAQHVWEKFGLHLDQYNLITSN